MARKLNLLFCLVFAIFLLTACSSKNISKAEKAYANGDYNTVVNLLEKMKDPKPEAVELLNKARIHLAFDAGNYEHVLALGDSAGTNDEEIGALLESAKSSLESEESDSQAAIVGFDEAPKADVELDIDEGYSIDGKTHYSLSQQEYDQLLSDVNRKIDDELNSCNKTSNFAQFPHFESVTSSEDRSKFTIVINDGNFDSASELALPEKLVSLAQMYAQYNQKIINHVTIEYRTMLGDLLNESVMEVSNIMPPAANQMESSVTSSEPLPNEKSDNGLTFELSKSVSSIVVGNMYQLSCVVQVIPSGDASGVYSFKYDVLQDGVESQSTGWISSDSYQVDLSGTGTCVLRISVQDSTGNVTTQDVDMLDH